MSQTETHGQKQKISKLAIASFTLGVLCCFIMALPTVIAYPPMWPRGIFVPNFVGVVGAFSLLAGIVAFVRIKKSRGMSRGSAFAIVGIFLTALISGMWLLDLMGRPRSTAHSSYCGSNLNRLGWAILMYQIDNGQYPDPNQWCDLLLKNSEVGVEQFVCPSIVLRWPFVGGRMFTWPVPKKGRSHYAMNPHCSPNSPPDTVLLFEAKEGWNRFGGLELITTEYHENNGCQGLLNKKGSRFWHPKRLGRLKWGNEKNK